jgi:hypothetical protein
MVEISEKLERIQFPAVGDENTPTALIIRVWQSGYVPDGVTVRAQISPNLFTCVVPHGLLSKLEKDEKVKSFSVSQELFSN